MKNNHTYKLARYTSAFLDYKSANEEFYKAVCKVSESDFQVEPSEMIERLARVLDIKHTHFLECGKRLLLY